MDDTNPLATQPIWPSRWTDARALALLLILALLLRGWVVYATQVPARDGIGFLCYALELERHEWGQVLRNHHQHPGYPLTILAVSWPIRFFCGTDCYAMQWSAQIASALAGVLLVVPMFFIGKMLFGRGIGFWGALLFQCIPASGHVLSDALSESLFLCLIAWSLWLGMAAVRGDSPRLFAGCGILSGLAYLVRPEGLLVLMATGCVLLAMQFVTRWKRPWPKALGLGTVLFLCGVLTGSPYFLATGNITNKPTAGYLTGEDGQPGQVPGPAAAVSTPGSPPTANLFAARIDMDGSLAQRWLRAARALVDEFIHAGQYWGALLALVGLWCGRDLYRRSPAAWVGLLLFVLQAGLLWWLAVKRGYVSDRNLLLLIMCSIFQTVVGAVFLGNCVATWFRQTVGNKAAGWPAVVLLMVLVVCGLVKTLQPMHIHRAGHHAAGVWLAAHAANGDVIVDDHCWANFYAGRALAREEMPPSNVPDEAKGFVVISRASERGSPTTPRMFQEEELLSRGGSVVFHWPQGQSIQQARVLIYALPRYGNLRDVSRGT
jgi:hypothetical protein